VTSGAEATPANLLELTILIGKIALVLPEGKQMEWLVLNQQFRHVDSAIPPIYMTYNSSEIVPTVEEKNNWTSLRAELLRELSVILSLARRI
jgi:hypothetical protein